MALLAGAASNKLLVWWPSLSAELLRCHASPSGCGGEGELRGGAGDSLFLPSWLAIAVRRNGGATCSSLQGVDGALPCRRSQSFFHGSPQW
jgi:hypothetical protein